ncbi:MAG: mechanosensitive ion channel family protein [Anaerolineales bacterium]
MEGLFESLKPYMDVFIIGVVGFCLAFLVSRFLTNFLSRFLGQGWSRLIGNLIALGIASWTVKLILDIAGAEGLVIVLVTVLTAAFAIGSERAAADLVSGVSLFFLRPYQVGDFVSVAGQEGRVRTISITQTVLESVVGDQIFIRNSDVIEGTIVNYSATQGHLITVHVILPATEDLNIAIDLIEKAIQGYSPDFSSGVYKPSVYAESGEPGYFNIEVHAYVLERLDYSAEKTKLFLLAVNALKNAGFSLAALDD